MLNFDKLNSICIIFFKLSFYFNPHISQLFIKPLLRSESKIVTVMTGKNCYLKFYHCILAKHAGAGFELCIR
jgi:hypothetical protein